LSGYNLKFLKFPPDTQSFSAIADQCTGILPFYDDICTRSASFIISCLSHTSHSIVLLLSTVFGRCNSVLGRNTLLCCLHFGWKLSDFACGDNDMSNAILSRSHRGIVNDSDWHAVRFLTDITDIRDGVVNLQFSGGSTLSSHELNDIAVTPRDISLSKVSFMRIRLSTLSIMRYLRSIWLYRSVRLIAFYHYYYFFLYFNVRLLY